MFLDVRAQQNLSSRCRLIAALTCALASPLGLQGQVPGEIRGRVIDVDSHRPIDGARVEVLGRGQFTVTQNDGSYVLRGLEPGDVALRVRAISYAPRDTTAFAANGRLSIVDIGLRVVASRFEPVLVQARRDSAATVVLNRATIERSGRRDLGELLQAVPGVVVTQAGGPGAPSHVSIRGSSANEVLVLVDGNPINSPITGEADLSRIGIESIERVSVMRGAQSARYGGRALAGVIAIETRHAANERVASGTLGAWGERMATLSLGQRRPRASVAGAASISADYRESRGDFSYDVPLVRGGGTARRLNADSRSLAVVGSASLESDGASLQLHAESDVRERGMSGSIVQPSLTGRQRESRVATGADARWTNGPWSSSATLDVAHEHESFNDPAPPFGSVYNDTVRATSATLSASSSVVLAGVASTIGVEGRTLDVTSTMLAPASPHVQRQLGAWVSERVTRPTAAGFEFSGDLTGRLDWDSLLSRVVASPRVGLTALHGPASLAAFFGGGYAPPSLADQFFHEGVLVRPNPSLHPERVRNEVEIRGALHDLRVGNLELEGDAAAFRADVDGLILWQPDFRFVWSPSNFDVTRTGWDASARIGIPALGVEARGSVSVVDVEYVGPALTGQVAYRPRTTANAIAALTRFGVRVEATTRYIGPRRSVTGSDLNALDSYSLADLHVSRGFTPRGLEINALVGVENVLDRSASMLVDYPFPGRTWTLGLRTRW